MSEMLAGAGILWFGLCFGFFFAIMLKNKIDGYRNGDDDG